MSIQSEIDRISGNISSTYTALEELGATMPENQNSDNLESTVRTVTAGGDNGTILVTFTKGATTAENTIDMSYDEIVNSLNNGRTVLIVENSSDNQMLVYRWTRNNLSGGKLYFRYSYQNKFKDLVIASDGTVSLEEGGNLLPSRKINGKALTEDITLTATDVAAVFLPVNPSLTETEGLDYGTAGQYAVSDGRGGIKWVDLPDGSEVSY